MRKNEISIFVRIQTPHESVSQHLCNKNCAHCYAKTDNKEKRVFFVGK
jgi:hypothetical protein